MMMVAFSVAAMAHAGSVYVSVDSWVYTAAERLAAITSTQAEIVGMRPWTRSQFAHFLLRAKPTPHDAEAERLQSTLEKEFAPEVAEEREHFALESVYVRGTQIAGMPLRDSYHFGQTIADDFGRPYGQGFNAIAGGSGYLQNRAVFLYVRGEYQHSASMHFPSAAAVASLAAGDLVQSNQLLTQGGPRVDQLRLLDTYAGVSFGRWTGTLGKQSLWWGPATGGAMMESNNAEPIWMARLTNDVPYHLSILGKTRIDLFYGKLQGHKFLREPWIHGEKISFQPLKSLEVGFTRTAIFLGAGRPLTFNRLWRSYFNVDDTGDADSAQNDPGDRRSAVDFSWKLPRIPVTLYGDSFSDDEPSPLSAPARSSFRPGLYIARFPGALAKLDLRMEGSYTASENSTVPNGFNYWNAIYRDGYTNKGLLIGDTVGRAGVSWQAWSTYWISPRNHVQVSYRNNYVSPQFLKGGETQNTVRTTSSMLLKHQLELQLGVQSERVVVPLLTGSRSPRYDVSGWAGLKYCPEHKVPEP